MLCNLGGLELFAILVREYPEAGTSSCFRDLQFGWVGTVCYFDGLEYHDASSGFKLSKPSHEMKDRPNVCNPKNGYGNFCYIMACHASSAAATPRKILPCVAAMGFKNVVCVFG